MDEQGAVREIARLDAIVRAEGGSSAFPALAEAHRRAGRAMQAEQVAREGLRRHPEQTAGRVALGLALLDQARLAEARVELQRVLDAVPDHALAQQALPEVEAAAEPDFLAEVADAELEHAFDVAEAQPEEMVDAHGVAAAALRAVECEVDSELVAAAAQVPPTPRFATRTMAELLERQGHADEARRIRASLVDEERPAEEPAARGRVIHTLEGWLDNLRKARR